MLEERTEQEKNLLPCLQAVMPWWTENDRLKLFAFICRIFSFDGAYMAGLPGATFERKGDGGTAQLAAADISREAFYIPKNKCSCASIRREKFDFGKLNPRLCYLCPFNATFRNQMQSNERRFLYYTLSSDYSIHEYMNSSKKKVEDVFRSYFPIYAKDYLVDAFPFHTIAQEFIDMPSDIPRSDRAAVDKYMKARFLDIAEKKIRYQRDKGRFTQIDPDYEAHVLNYIMSEYETIYETKSFSLGLAVNQRSISRLFKSISAPPSYSAKKPADLRLNAELDSNEGGLFEDFCLQYDIQLPTPLHIGKDDSVAPFSEPVKSKALKEEKKQQASPKSHITDTSQEFENFLVQSGPEDYAKASVLPKETLHDTFDFPEAPSAPQEKPKTPAPKMLKPVPDKGKGGVFLPEYPAFFPMLKNGKFLFYEENSEKGHAVLYALISDSSFFCMEPVECENIRGVLIMNEEKDFIFYPAEVYGTAPLKQIFESGAAVYTTSIFHLSRYLLASKINHFNLTDLCLLNGIVTDKAPLSICGLFPDLFLIDAMKEYRIKYLALLKNLDSKKQELFELYSKFIPLLHGDGAASPFQNTGPLFEQEDVMSYRQQFRKEQKPSRSGIYVFVKTIISDFSFSSEKLFLYMKACVLLNDKSPFCKGRSRILNISDFGILFYLTGTAYELTEIPLYIKSSVRQAFTGVASGNTPAKIEIQISEPT